MLIPIKMMMMMMMTRTTMMMMVTMVIFTIIMIIKNDDDYAMTIIANMVLNNDTRFHLRSQFGPNALTTHPLLALALNKQIIRQ